MGWINLFTVTALLIQITMTQSQSRPRCSPTNWSHAWSRFGSVWYTILHSAGPFFEKEKQCRLIEHGRTQMGRITSQGEQNHVHIMFSELSPKQDLWLGGMRLAEGEFYWFRQKDDKRNSIEMEKVKKAYWTKGNPDNSRNKENCIEMHYNYGGYGGQWNDVDCNDQNFALCELRC